MKDTLKPLMTSNAQDWRTPPELYAKLCSEFSFTLDPCADDENHLCSKYYTAETNGLIQDWTGETCYINPPPIVIPKRGFKRLMMNGLITM